MGLAGVYGAVDPAVATATVHAALDAGIVLFDAAPLYGAGRAERLLGAALPPGRGRVCTKFGLSEGCGGTLVRDSRPASVRKSVELSLRMLGRDFVDILLQHRPDPDVPDEAVAEVLLRLVEEGKARHVGLSGTTCARAAAMGRIAPLAAVQNELSAAVAPGAPDAPVRFADHGLVFMAHSPLARGVLARDGQRVFPEDDHRARMPALTQAGQAALQRQAAARGIGAQPSNVRAALRFVLSECSNVVAVVGARSPAQIADAATADGPGAPPAG